MILGYLQDYTFSMLELEEGEVNNLGDESPLLHRIMRSPTFITQAFGKGGTSMNSPALWGFSILEMSAKKHT